MKTQTLIARIICPETMAGHFRTACARKLLPLLLLLAMPAAVQAQCNYTNNYGVWTYTITNGAIAITEYTGSGGAVTIPSAINSLPVTGIGSNAFFFCSNLTSVTIPNSITNIGDYAFQGCMSLTSVTLGTNITSIGEDAFLYCGSLSGVAIPSSVTSIGDGAFLYCLSLTAITVDALNPVYSSVDGVLFDKSQATLIQCPGGKAGSWTIPSSVTSIGDSAFMDCASLAAVTIPNSVTNLGDWAFGGCTSLTDITIPNSVTSIGQNAFFDCATLTNVTIPDSVTSIGNQAFANCSRLTAITVDALNSAYSSLDGVLFQRKQTVLIQYPGGKGGTYTIPDSVTNIGTCAFLDCASLTSVTIGNSVTRIAGSAFFGCTSLKAIYFQGNAPSADSSVCSGDDDATV
jgi:hypothetical protein